MTETNEFAPDAVRPAPHITLVHNHFDWGTVRADIVKRTGLSRQETHVAPEQHSFLINLHGEARAGEDFVEGRRVAFQPRRRGSVSFVPAHGEWTGWDDGDSAGSYMFVSIKPTFIEQVLGQAHLASLKTIIGLRNSPIEASLQQIASELRNRDPISVLMVESQAIQLFVHLLRSEGARTEPSRGGLSQFDLKRVIGMIEARSSDPPTLDELAKEIGVSRRHFFRAFKQSTGKAPHAYLSEHRLKRAADLLRATDHFATQIALECGFSSSSHLTFAFKRAFGVGPLEFRRKWRS